MLNRSVPKLQVLWRACSANSMRKQEEGSVGNMQGSGSWSCWDVRPAQTMALIETRFTYMCIKTMPYLRSLHFVVGALGWQHRENHFSPKRSRFAGLGIRGSGSEVYRRRVLSVGRKALHRVDGTQSCSIHSLGHFTDSRLCKISYINKAFFVTCRLSQKRLVRYVGNRKPVAS